MKKFIINFSGIILTSAILAACGPSASDPCDCFNNALKKGDSDFDAQLAKECDDYESNLTHQEYLDRLGEIDRRGCVEH